MKATKLVDGINLEQDSRKYKLVEVLINSNDSDMSDCLSKGDLPIKLPTKIVAEVIPRVVICQIRIKAFDNLDKLCTLYVGSKSIQIVRQYKSMTAATNK